MNTLKYFNQEGTQFLSKKNLALVVALLIISGLLLTGAYRIFSEPKEKPGKVLFIILGCIAFLMALVQYRMQLIIDTSAKTFEMKGALVPKKLKSVYSFDDFSRFEVQKVYALRMPVYISPVAYFKKNNGKEQLLPLRTFNFYSKPVQHYLDEVSMIMKKAENR